MTILTSDIVAWWSLTKKGSRIAPEALSTQILIRIRRSSLVVASGGGGGGDGTLLVGLDAEYTQSV